MQAFYSTLRGIPALIKMSPKKKVGRVGGGVSRLNGAKRSEGTNSQMPTRVQIPAGAPPCTTGLRRLAKKAKLNTSEQTADVKGKIVKTLFTLKNRGLAKGTLKNVSAYLRKMMKHADLNNPEDVKFHIAEMKCENSYKNVLVKAYNYYLEVNSLTWQRPKYKCAGKLPKIPTTEQINKIISSASKKYAVIFTLLAETGAMPHELHNVTLRDIDLERGINHIPGFKGHLPRSIKLKGRTVAMLKLYLAKHNSNQPFPTALYMGKEWRKYRDRIAKKLQDIIVF